ncbi:MAG TPA: sigma-70 family RNA polymerase sigma factor [Gemmatimonadales bacterium]
MPAPARPAIDRPLTAAGLELVRRAQHGDEAAFERLYREHVGRVYALCIRMLGDATQAEELVQDVFVQVWRRLRTFAGQSAFSTWLHRVAVNVVLMDRRAAGRRARHLTSTGDVPDAELPSHDPPAGLRMDLEQAIAALPAGAREVFVLYDVEGYTHEEIAKLLGIAAGTSKAQLFRARRLLREKLER